ncbi:MAG: BCSC C-terminal domain-containing protein [Cyanobacteria bacterium REEB65]|nr:BCSC C-terminal domain-containing protein [Cyanobacteria bacterium REEB65]
MPNRWAALAAAATLSWSPLLAAQPLSQGHLILQPIGPTLAPRWPADSSGPAGRTSTPAVSAIDERPLWDLFHQHRLAELSERLAALEAHHPTWQPPAALVRALADAQLAAAVQAALQAHDPHALIALALRSPRAFSAAHIDRAWDLADAWHQVGNPQATLAVVHRLLETETAGKLRLATLEKARSWLAPDRYLALLQEAAAARADSALDKLYLAEFLNQAAHPASGSAPVVIPPLAARCVDASQNAADAMQFGWLEAHQHAWPQARAWFAKALEWQPSSPQASYALALCDFELGQIDAAYDLTTPQIQRLPAARELHGAIAQRKGQLAYAAGQYAVAMAWYDRAASDLGKTAGLLEEQAWTYYRQGKEAEAARRFRALYFERHDGNAAQGLVLSLEATHDQQAIAAITHDATLSIEVRNYRSDQAFFSGLWDLAYSLAPRRHPDLAGLGQPVFGLTAGFETRHAGGGPADMTVVSLPVGGATTLDRAGNRWTLTLARLGLQSPGAAETTGFLPTLDVRHSGQIAYWAQAGTTPLSPGSGIRPDLAVGLSLPDRSGRTDLAAYSHPVGESTLSWLGAKDSADRVWGEVSRSGLSFRHVTTSPASRSISLTIAAEVLTGQALPRNEHAGANLDLVQDLGALGSLRTTAGVRVSLDTYRANLDGYDYGMGGYFSPQFDERSEVIATLQSPPIGHWLIQGNLAAGPEYAAGLAYLAGQGAFNHLGFDLHGDLRVAFQLGSHLQVSCALSDDHAVSYDDQQISFSLWGTIGPRASVTATTTPMGASMQP